MLDQEFPILEFDDDTHALIRPHDVIEPTDIAQRCVLCFFGEAIETIINEHPHRIAASFHAESLVLPVYEFEYNGEKITLMQAAVGAPLAAMQIEELSALGCKKFIACGSCGVLDKDIELGKLIIPTAAVRDEGTSYHYAKPSREIDTDENVIGAIENVLKRSGVPYYKGKTWTTDAVYRETQNKICKRKEEGCITVEMEAAAYMAAARYNGVAFGQILYAGDNLDAQTWDNRDFNRQYSIRERVLALAMDACLEL